MRYLIEASDSSGPLAPASGVEPVGPGRYDPIEIDSSEVADGEGLRRYWELLQRNKGRMAACIALGAIAGFVISLPQTPIYQARAGVEIDAVNENYLDLGDVSPTSGGAGRMTESEIATHVKMLESRALLEAVVDRLGLAERERFQRPPSRLASWRETLGLVDAPPLTPDERALQAARENVRAAPSAKTRIVEIVSEWEDPELAARFANQLAETYIERGLEARWESTQRSSEYLGRQLEELRLKLESSAEELEQYARTSGLMFTAEKESVAQERLRQLQQELSRAQADRIQKQSRVELIRAAELDRLPEVVDNEAIEQRLARAADLRRELAELRASYTDEYWKVRRVRAQLVETRRTIESELTRARERARTEFEAAARRQALLERSYERQAGLVSEQSERAIRYDILKGEVETNRELYDHLLQKVKEAGVASAMRVSHIRLVDPARPPRLPHRPNHLFNALLGLLAGGLFGLGLVVLGERLDQTIKQPGELSKHLRVAELGIVPAASSARKRSEKASRGGGERSPGEPRLELVGEPAGAGRGPRSQALPIELAARNERSMVAEYFRAAVTSILFASRRGEPPRTMVVTSASPGEGKTTVASNLAVCLAEIKGRVLLVDADMRKPRQHRIFDVSNRSGLSDVLRGVEPIADLVSAGLVQPTTTPGLSVLPSGSPFFNIPNLLHSPALRELLTWAESEFDAVVIDTPPMLQIADARVLGQMADGVVLVVRSGRTSRASARAAADRLQEDGTRVLGAILNSWDPEADGYGYYDNYHRYDSYYADDERRSEKTA